MLREVFRSRMFFVGLLVFMLIVVGRVFYLKHAEREAAEDLVRLPERVKPLTEAQKLTYHAELLETHPVEALRQQTRELGHWSAEHIPPFPPEDPEAANFARDLYIMRYYKYTEQIDDPAYLAADQAQGEFRHALSDHVVETPWEHARKLDLKKLTWPDTTGLSGLATTSWVTTFTEGINPESARSLYPIELENSNLGRRDSQQRPAKTGTPQDDMLPDTVSNPTGTWKPLTYHVELLETHPVEALRQQAWELGHWSAEHIPPFPPEDQEAADFARNTYLFLYYMRTEQTDHPAYLAAMKARRDFYHTIRRDYDAGFKNPWEFARNCDLQKITWSMIPPLNPNRWPTTFTEGINPESARPLLPFELDESLWRRTSD